MKKINYKLIFNNFCIIITAAILNSCFSTNCFIDAEDLTQNRSIAPCIGKEIKTKQKAYLNAQIGKEFLQSVDGAVGLPYEKYGLFLNLHIQITKI